MISLIQTVKNKYHRTLIEVLFRLGFVGDIVESKNGGAILCYHGIDLSSSKKYNMRFVSKKSLENQFRFMKKYFNVISVDDFFDQKFETSKFNIAITFDDGYKNNYRYAFPLIEKYQIPCSFYITGLNNTPYNFLWADMLDIVYVHSKITELEFDNFEFSKSSSGFFTVHGTSLKKLIKFNGGWDLKVKLIEKLSCFQEIIKKEQIDDYWRLMTDKEIVEISKSPYIDIQSHGFFHNNLGNTPLNEGIDEVLKSKKYLENLIQKPVNGIAYPDGSYSREIVQELKLEGFTNQLALGYLFDEDQTESSILNRHGIYPVYSDSFQLKEIPNLVF